MNTFRPLHPRHHIDASVGDALFALFTSALPHPVKHRPDSPLACLSVRSAFELLLDTLDFEYGDEVIVSGVTHPDMIRIIELHGLVPVAVDIDPETLAPDNDALQRAVNSKTRIVMVAHLFGAEVNIDDVVALSLEHNLLIVEDRAQSIRGANDKGDVRAHVSLFSFGFIKTATAFGGALAYVRHPELASQMRVRHDQWPVQSRLEYAKKALKCIAALTLSNRWIYGYASSRYPDLGALVRTASFTNEYQFVQWMRRRPSGGLVRTLKRRLRHFPENRMRERRRVGNDIASALPDDIMKPGSKASDTTHWLFPVVTNDPADLVAVCAEAGFEATQATSQITAVDESLDGANWMMQGIVFLPAYPEMPAREHRRLIRLLTKFSARNSFTNV